VDLHEALKELATSTSGKGRPAILHLRSRVVSVNQGVASLTLEDGSTHTGDLVIAADGINSKIRTDLVKGITPPEPSGSSAFRFLIPVEEVRSDPQTAHFVEKTGELRLLYGSDRRIVIYPCRNNTLLNFVAMHPDEESEATADWDQTASKDKMLSCFSTFPDDVRALLSKASPLGVKLWKLLDHDELGEGNWTHGKAALLGDAAHAFLPHQGQGGAQAIEDGAALGALFPLGTRPSDVYHRLDLYVKARYKRATLVQDFTRQAAFKTARGKHGGDVIDPMQFSEINFNHDAFDHARGILLRDLSQRALYRRMPIPFGPCPGPRQDLSGRARKQSKYVYKTSFVTFKSPKTSLSVLLPSDEWEICSTGSWGTATFSVTRLSNLDWLGGRGYSFFGLYVHDVVYTSGSSQRADPEPSDIAADQLRGDFLPVLFENMADPITTGREELGFAKMFATLEETTTPSSSLSYSAGWEGTEFCRISLEDIVENPQAESALQTPILHYKVIASSRAPGLVDAEYMTTYPALPSEEGERRWESRKAQIRFTDLEGEDLQKAFPTLAHVVTGLREVKIAEILRAGVQASA
jgi:2-polyprenyl-6-methoxyphenol hydroxylase-like FAD-dependent oxidoreductase